MAKNRGGRGAGQMNRGRGNFNNRQGGPMKQRVQSQQFRLNRAPDIKRVKIEQNLVNLKKNLKKKQAAQSFYYSNGRSPVKNNKAPQQSRAVDPNSVHNRLGNKSSGFRTNNTKQTTRVFNNRNNPRNSVLGGKVQKFNRNMSVQQRIQRIRQNNGNNSRNDGNFTRKLQLRRNQPTAPAQPTNVTIKVENPGRIDADVGPKHNIGSQLNPRLQAEIRMIQSKSSFQDVIPSIPIHPQGAGVTKTSLHERFSHLR